jgi:hypothetical protein
VIYPIDGTWADDARTLLQRLDQVVPSERPITRLAERIHAGEAFLTCLDELGWSNIIRLPEDTYIETEPEGWKEVRHVRKRRGRLVCPKSVCSGQTLALDKAPNLYSGLLGRSV